MKQPVLYLSRAEFKAVKKFRRLTARLRGMIQDESYYQISLQERNSFLKKLKTLFKRVTGLQHRFGVKLAGATFAMLLLAGNLSAQKYVDVTGTPGDPFFVAENPFYKPAPVLEYSNNEEEPKPTLVDIDNDGDLDLFIANEESYIAFYRNTGTNSAPMFEAVSGSKNPANGIYTEYSSGIAFADFDKDGDKDMFVGDYYGGVDYFKNVGTATSPRFSSDYCGNPLSSISGEYYQNIAFADIDNDGDLDLFAGGDDSGIKFWRNITSGTGAVTFSTPESNPFGLYSGYNKTTIALVDLDGDNDLDAVTGNDNGYLDYFRNIGTASAACFTPSGCDSPFMDFALDNTAPAFADIDNDGDKDLILGYYDGGPEVGIVTIVPNKGSNSSPIFQVPDEGEQLPIIRLADVDNDGDSDAFFASESGLKFYKNTGSKSSPKLEEQEGSNNPFADVYNSEWIPAFVDLDGDDDLDLVTGYPGYTKSSLPSTPLLYYKNLLKESSQLAFSLVTSTSTPLSVFTAPYAPEFADIDGDGDMDAITGDGDYILYYKNVGTSSAPVFSDQGTGSANPFTNVDPYIMGAFFVDIDNDGSLEAFVNPSNGLKASPPPSGIAMYEKVGNDYELVDAEDNPLSGFMYGFVSSFADMDDDGDYDTFFGKYGNLKYVKNSGSATLARMEEAPASFGLMAGMPVFANIDPDSDLEVMAGGVYQITGLPYFDFEKEGSKGRYFAKKGVNNPFYEYGPVFIHLADFEDVDGDGLDDMIFCGTLAEGGSGPVKVEEPQPDAMRYFKNVSTESDGVMFEEVSGTANPFSTLAVYYPGYSAPVFADMDSDGDNDLITFPNPFFGGPGKSASTGLWKPVNMDFNHIAAGCCGPMIQYFQNNEGEYEEQYLEDTPFADLANSSPQIFNLKFVDIDADGDLDVFAIGPDYYSSGPSTRITLFENLADEGIEGLIPREGNLNPLAKTIEDIIAFGMDFVDFDSDGDQDVLFTGLTGYYYGSVQPYKFARNESLLNGVKTVADTRSKFQVYPNPVNGQINFLYRLESADNVQVKVLDLTGKALISQSFDRMQKGEQVSIESGSLASGMYLLQLNAGGKSYQTKFMKQ